MIARLALTAACLAATLCAAPAREQIPAEERIYGYNAERVPGCDNPAVLSRLQSRFRAKEAGYWASSLEIVAFSNLHTTHFRPNGLDLIPRRYCRGTVLLNNNRQSPLYYVVTQDGGMAGHDFAIHFCVAAYDRNWAYSPECKMAKP